MTEPGNPRRKALKYRDAFGMRQSTEFTVVGDLALPGAVLPARIVADHTGRRMVQKWVSHRNGDSHPGYFDLLDNEIRAGARLGQAFVGARYPVELPRLIGYDVDSREPFVLLEEYRGEPATQHANRMSLHERHRFQLGLLRALRHTGVAGLVHGGVSLTTLRWDGTSLQLVDFEQAAQAGEPRRRSTTSLRSPEQADGVGAADPRDDIWAAGAIIHEMTTGRHANGGRYDLSPDPEALRFLLQGVFTDQAADRPDAAELLGRLRADASVETTPGPAAVLAAGRQAFEEASARKRGWTPEPQVLTPPPPAKENTGKTVLVVGVVLLLMVLSAVMILGAI